MLNEKTEREFKRFLKDQRGQTNLIGNAISFIETQPWIMAVIFLAAVYSTTFKIEIFGFELSVASLINDALQGVASGFGFGFDWRLIVIIIFLALPVGFIFKYGW